MLSPTHLYYFQQGYINSVITNNQTLDRHLKLTWVSCTKQERRMRTEYYQESVAQKPV